MRILIIEDEEDIALPLKKSLERVGYAVDFEATGTDGLKAAQINSYDLILLDLNLPEIDGIDLANKLRDENNNTPIIMLTARSQIYDKLEGFDKGADDYITKPFVFDELLARIKAVIKRNSTNKDQSLNFSGMTLKPAENLIVGTKGESIALTNKETGILEYLLRSKGKIVSAEELLEHAWDREADMFSDTVKTHIKTIRKKIDPQRNILKTVRGKGYQLVL
ncbi:MAG: response regulator transcription factor [Candidatus Dojkabacteria bacterium]